MKMWKRRRGVCSQRGSAPAGSPAPLVTRRHFLAAIPAVAALAETKPLKISAVEIWELHGHRESLQGVDQQYQVNPLYIYDDLRPKPYRDAPSPTARQTAVTTYYLKIVTD